MSTLTDLLGLKVLQPAAQTAIMDPATRGAVEFQLAQALQSDQVRAALRPVLGEAAIWIGAAVFVSVLVATQIGRK
tara:strand:- start:501 stop:728 length:228 start_codon:yes stop_codon:yes gene_type:complete